MARESQRLTVVTVDIRDAALSDASGSYVKSCESRIASMTQGKTLMKNGQTSEHVMYQIIPWEEEKIKKRKKKIAHGKISQEKITKYATTILRTG